jgi:hypothetical protein
LELNIEKYYRYARGISNYYGDDLLHHLIVENDILNKLEKVHEKARDRYMYRALLNEFTNKKSKFYRIAIKPDVEKIEADTTPASGYDIIPVHTILLSLENEGYKLEVKVFKECYLANTSKSELSRRTKTDKRAITSICDFVKNEIRNRYVRELD